jgi:hypothetical protein
VEQIETFQRGYIKFSGEIPSQLRRREEMKVERNSPSIIKLDTTTIMGVIVR